MGGVAVGAQPSGVASAVHLTLLTDSEGRGTRSGHLESEKGPKTRVSFYSYIGTANRCW